MAQMPAVFYNSVSFTNPLNFFQFYMDQYGWHPAFSSASTGFEIETQESNIHS